MERGLNGAGDGLLLIKNNTNKQKLSRRGKQDSWQGLAGQGKTRQGRAGTGNIRRRTGTGRQTQGDYKGSK